nr:hypothetical protein [Tanacetum cinerariifolium]
MDTFVARCRLERDKVINAPQFIGLHVILTSRGLESFCSKVVSGDKSGPPMCIPYEDHHLLDAFKPTFEIKELDDDVYLDASVVRQSRSVTTSKRPLSCDDDIVSLVKVVEIVKVVEVLIEHWFTTIDHNLLESFKIAVEIEELDNDVDLDASVVRQSSGVTTSKRLALEYVHKNVHVDESVCDAGPSLEEQALLFMEAQDRMKKRPFFKVA